MKLKLVRKYRKETYTIGKLYVDGVYFCDTIEDKDRGLDDTMYLADILLKKKLENDCTISSAVNSPLIDLIISTSKLENLFLFKLDTKTFIQSSSRFNILS